MAILSISPEVVMRITFYINPSDMSSFARTCKPIYECAKSRLKEQRSMQNYYWPVLEPGKEQMLSDIFRNPRISFYARKHIPT